MKEQAEKLPADTWVVIAAYNESRRIGAVLDTLVKVVPNVVVVDDGSSDSTVDEVKKRPVWLAQHLVNLGQGAALQTGLDFCFNRQAQYVVTFDADGQHDVHDIAKLIAALRNEAAEFALGSRFLGEAEGIPLSRKLVLKAATHFTRFFSGIALTDAHNGLRALTRKGLENIRITMNRMEHASEIVHQISASGLKYVEVPVRIRYTADSLAKGQRTSNAVKLGLKLIIERFAK